MTNNQSVAEQCREIWRAAYSGHPTTIQLNSIRELDRARFAFYGALKSKESEEGRQWKEMCEVSTNRKDLTLTVQLKANNPFNKKFSHALAMACAKLPEGGVEAIAENPAGIDESLEMLRQLQEAARRDTERESTPYYKREE